MLTKQQQQQQRKDFLREKKSPTTETNIVDKVLPLVSVHHLGTELESASTA